MLTRRIFGPKREEVAEEWRRLHNGEFHNLYASQNSIIRVKEDEMGGSYGTYGT
jgi:hypothetical protein